jgi:hypothetical protein
MPVHLRTGHICPGFEWSTSLDHFICRENFLLYLKWSRLAEKNPIMVFEWLKQDGCHKHLKTNIYVRFVEGLC